jgi:hypothetical protein
MNNNQKIKKALPNQLTMKVFAVVMTSYITMQLVMKNLTPLIYGAAATQSAIFKVEAIALMPALMIGTSLLAMRAETLSLKRMLLTSFLATLGASCIESFAFPVF